MLGNKQGLQIEDLFSHILTQNHNCHAENLDTAADYGSKEFRISRRAKNVSMDKFPTRFLHRFIITVVLVVPKSGNKNGAMNPILKQYNGVSVEVIQTLQYHAEESG